MKKVLITGCSKGIGLAIVEKLLASDTYEIYGMSREEPDLKANKNFYYYRCDLTIPEDTLSCAQKILLDSGGIDGLVNNAGTSVFKPIDKLDITEWRQVMDINLTAPYVLMHVFLPSMKDINRGKVINITSDAEKFSYEDAGVYCASKAGLKMLSDCVRKELEGYNITVTTIAPGRVDTHFNHKVPGDRPNSLRPGDVAEQVAILLAQDSKYEVEQIYLNSISEKSLH